VRLFFVL